jgi:hypothetical protein
MRLPLRILLGLGAALAALFTTTRSKDAELRRRRLYARTAITSGVQESAAGLWRGGSVRALFGGVQLDLRHARLPDHGAVLDAVAVCGGIRLVVPVGWSVTVDGTPVMGGVSIVHEADDGPRLLVRARILCGGLRIDNGEPVRLDEAAWLDVEEE